MRNTRLFGIISLALCLLLALSGIGITAFAEEADFCELAEYTITDKPPFITKNTTFDISIKLKVIESFSGAFTKESFEMGDDYSFSKKIPSTPQSITAESGFVTLTFEKVKYTGNGNTFEILIKHPDNASRIQRLIFAIDGCEEYRPGSYSSEVTAPDVLISRSSIDTPIKAGEKFSVKITVKNNSSKPTMENPTAYISPSEAFIITDVSNSYRLPNIQGGKNASFYVNMQALETISSPSQSIDIEIRYTYYSGSMDTQTTASQKLFIPAEKTETVDEKEELPPVLRITRGDITSPIVAGQNFSVSVKVENLGKQKVENPVAFVSPTDAFMLSDSTGSKYLSSIDAGESITFNVDLKAMTKISSPAQGFDIELKYRYTISSKNTTHDGSASEKIWVPVTITNDDEKPSEAAPVLEITRNVIQNPIKANEETSVVITVKNLGVQTIEKPVAFITAPESFMLLDSTASKVLDPIAPGKSISFTIKLKAMEKISSPAQSLNIEINYSYVTDNVRSSGNASEKIWIPAVVTLETSENAIPPMLEISRSTMRSINGGESFTVTVSVKNLSDKTIEAPIAKVSPNGDFILTDSTSSRILEPIAPNGEETFDVSLKAAEKINSEAQKLAVDISYSYISLGNRTEGSKSEEIQIPANVTKTDDDDKEDGPSAATPNIIISKYDFGGTHVVTGNDFELSVEFKNTSKTLRVENIVMTIEPGEGLSIAAASNTYYYESLKAAGTNAEKLMLQALPTAKTGSVNVNVSFRYEYVSNKVRSSQSSSQTISIPLIQQDRFEASLGSLPEFVNAGEEVYVSLTYINKGKADISNVHAELIGDVSALEKEQNLGNFEPGKSGTIDFILMPSNPGEVDAAIAITYEDPNLEEKTLEFPLKFTVNEMIFNDFPIEGGDMPIEEEKAGGIPWWVWVIVGVGIIAIAVLVIVVVKKRKKNKKNAELEGEFNWDDAEPTVPSQEKDAVNIGERNIK